MLDEAAVEARWGLPAEITAAILQRRCAVAGCDTKKIAQYFLPFTPGFDGFFKAPRSGVGDMRRATDYGGELRFDPISADDPNVTIPAENEWFMLCGISTHPDGEVAYREFCAALGKDDQSDVMAFAHGRGVHAPRHTDLAGGLVLMLEGHREWRVEPPLVRGDGIFSALKQLRWGEGFNAAVPVIETVANTAIYIPGGWWHETRSITPSLTIRIGIAERTVARATEHIATGSSHLHSG